MKAGTNLSNQGIKQIVITSSGANWAYSVDTSIWDVSVSGTTMTIKPKTQNQINNVTNDQISKALNSISWKVTSQPTVTITITTLG